MGSRTHYEWDRFWRERGEPASPLDDGFLADPHECRQWHIASSAVPLGEIRSAPCLVLLGEPGIGKSQAIRDICEPTRPAAHGGNVGPTMFNLKSFGSESDLWRALRDRPGFRQWADGGEPLELYLDSLDECLLRAPTVVEFLIEKLNDLRGPMSQLRLRLTCRTAEWSDDWEGDLAVLWPEPVKAGVYELMPLRRRDVIAAAVADGLDPDLFMAEVGRVAAVPLAATPVTLRFLLDLFKRDNLLPKTRGELYRKGCELLCHEPSGSRQRLRPAHGVDRRMRIAGRIAAATVFGNRASIHDGPRATVPDAASVPIADLAGSDAVGSEVTGVEEDEIREVLNTGLFTSRGPGLLGWAHQTYAEFLAAWYVRERGATVTQVLSLIGQTAGQSVPVPPQLHEAAAWLAMEFHDVCKHLVEREPAVILRSDVATLNDQMRAQLVDTILGQLDREEAVDPFWSFRRTLTQLGHPGLRVQVEPWIVAHGKKTDARYFAVDLALYCRLGELLPTLVAVALDPGDDHVVRAHAAHVVNEIGRAEFGPQLLPLAKGESGEDDDDELKGSGLMATWPGTLATPDVFALVTFPKRSNLTGNYQWFIRHVLVPGLTATDLPVALEWVRGREYHNTSLDVLNDVADAVILRAWDADAVRGPLLPLLADVVIARFAVNGPLVNKKNWREHQPLWQPDDPRRRLLLNEVVRRAGGSELRIGNLTSTMPPLLTRDDLPWIIEQLTVEPTGDVAERWIAAIWSVIGWDVQDSGLLFHALHVPAVKQAFGCLFETMDLDDPRGAAFREQRRQFKADQERYEMPLLDPPPTVWLARALQRSEGGERGAWYDVYVALMLHERQGEYWHEHHNADLRTTSVWKNATASTRNRVLTAARHHLTVIDLNAGDRFATSALPDPLKATYRAFVLIELADPSWIEHLPSEDWRRWAPAIFNSASASEGEDYNVRYARIARLYGRDPAMVISLALQMLEEPEEYRRSALYALDGCWDDRLQAAFVGKLRDPQLTPAAYIDLLGILLRRGDPKADATAAGQIQSPLPPDGPDRQRFEAVCVTALENATPAAWRALWNTIRGNAEWGEHLLLRVASMIPRRVETLPFPLPEQDLADVYEWLRDRFPPEADPVHHGLQMHPVTGRQGVSSLRDGFLQALQQRGTVDAVTALARLVARRPELPGLRRALEACRRSTVQQTWTPPSVTEVLGLLRDTRSRLVMNADHLLDLVVESIGRWQAELQGQTPAAYRLWDSPTSGKSQKHRPKPEGKLANDLKLHLERDLGQYRGVVANREVVIRDGEKPGGQGERLDVLVQAVTKRPSREMADVVAVIVEVKGCWNAELRTAMECQLRDRYLADNGCRHGLYVVGWYACPQWDVSDRRQKATPRMSIGEIRALLAAQAADLSAGGVTLRSIVADVGLR